MKKIEIRTIIFVLVGIAILKIYCFLIVNKVYYKINCFREIENRYYEVTTFEEKNFKCREEIFRRENEIKYIILSGNTSKLYFEIRDFSTNKKCFWISKIGSKRIFGEHELYITDKKFMPSSPNSIWRIYKNNKFNLNEFLKIHYIIPVKYEGKSCYKIVTKLETIIIDKDTYLPIYVCENWVNSEDDNSCKMEYFYEFEINTVTEEDMQKL